jgi:hypothetical protein
MTKILNSSREWAIKFRGQWEARCQEHELHDLMSSNPPACLLQKYLYIVHIWFYFSVGNLRSALGSVPTSALATAYGIPGTLNAKHSQLLKSSYTSHIISFFQKYSLMSLMNSNWSFRFSLENSSLWSLFFHYWCVFACYWTWTPQSKITFIHIFIPTAWMNCKYCVHRKHSISV